MVINLFLLLILCSTYHCKSDPVKAPETFLTEFDTACTDAVNAVTVASWNYATNINEDNQKKQTEASLKYAEFEQQWSSSADEYNWRNFTDADMKRQFKRIANKGDSVLSQDQLKEMHTLQADMETIYSTAKVCECKTAQCYPLDPDLTKIFKTSNDYDLLKDLWKGWRDFSGKKMKDKYEKFVVFQNEVAKLNGFSDAGEYWRDSYEIENLQVEMERLWVKLKPFYQNLHAYVLRKLKAFYKGKPFPKTNHIPAHLLGNMWAQQWYINDITLPYKNAANLDVTDALVEQKYTAKKIAELSEKFFTSIGLDAMPASFWEKSLLEKPEDREVVCHASAWDFGKDSDFRIKQCTETTMEWLQTTHHEMGHIQYYLQYKDQPIVFREGANPGFHEAVGDIMSLSVATPEYLKTVGLLQDDEFDKNDKESEINYLFQQALEKVAFLPFGYLIDLWRWNVFSGKTKPEDYNNDWWALRCKYQGVSPPVARSDDDFDPGAKYHVPANVPYIRYFVSYVIQYQIHEALCNTKNHTGPLYKCSIYNSEEAGEKLGNMLKLGSSIPWPEALKEVTGKDTWDTSSILKYFEPLYEYLKKENEGHSIEWDDKCPPESFSSGSSMSKISVWSLLLSTLLIHFFKK